MHIGACVLEIYLPDVGSLKHKRRIIKGSKERIRRRFNVSIAEIGNHDVWQRATIGIACIGNDSANVHSVIMKVTNFLRQNHSLEIIHMEVTSF